MSCLSSAFDVHCQRDFCFQRLLVMLHGEGQASQLSVLRQRPTAAGSAAHPLCSLTDVHVLNELELFLFFFFFFVFLPLSSHQLPVNEQAVMSPWCLCGSLISSSWLVQPVEISGWIYFLLSLFLLPHFFSWTFPLSLLSSFFGSFVGVSAQTNNNDHASMSVSSSAWLLLPRASVLQAEVERNAC